MIIYEELSKFNIPDNPVVTIGTFDGVHLGHRKILERVCNIAETTNGTSVIITFWPHPRLVLYPEETDLKLLSTFKEKAKVLQDYGIDHLIKIPFTESFAKLTSQEFIVKILVKAVGTKKLVIGYNHRFGNDREGGFQHLVDNANNYGFEVEEIPRQEVDNIGISSSKIRKALFEGEIENANEFLGRPYNISGQVVKGDQIGRDMGFPTANIQVNDAFKLIPSVGIYAVKVNLSGEAFKGMLYIGSRPTLNRSRQSIEVNIFDFDKNIYDEKIDIFFYSQLRKDAKFKNLDQLKAQLEKDKIAATHALNQ